MLAHIDTMFLQEVERHFPNRSKLSVNEHEKIKSYYVNLKVSEHLESVADKTINRLADKGRYSQTIVEAMKNTN